MSVKLFRELDKEMQQNILKSITCNAKQIVLVKKLLDYHIAREKVFKKVVKNQLPLDCLLGWVKK